MALSERTQRGTRINTKLRQIQKSKCVHAVTGFLFLYINQLSRLNVNRGEKFV